MSNQNNKINRIAQKIRQIKAENTEHLRALERNNQFLECLVNNILAVAEVCEPFNIQFLVVSTLENEEISIVRKA